MGMIALMISRSALKCINQQDLRTLRLILRCSLLRWLERGEVRLLRKYCFDALYLVSRKTNTQQYFWVAGCECEY